MDETTQQDEPTTPQSPSQAQSQPIHPRGYQQELLEESKRRNIIIALDTGAGKTHIAILRIRYELEREHTKVCWFLTPNVALCTQQYNVIKSSSLGTVAIVYGALRPEQWKDPSLWRSLVDSHRVIVSTPQVLLDALRHGYINLGQIALLCFDEAHHCVEQHPYRCIMSEFYHPRLDIEEPVPHILGLTASPMFGGQDVVRSFKTIEENLNCVIRTVNVFREELATYVHRPTFRQLAYPPIHPKGPLFSSNLAVVKHVVQGVSIDNDPYVVALRRKLGQPDHSDPAARLRLDRQLSKAIQKADTYTQESLRRLVTTAEEILKTIGAWAADWFVNEVIEQVKANANPFNNAVTTLQTQEKQYLRELLTSITTTPTSYYHYDISSDCQPKVDLLIKCLLEEKQRTEELNEPYMGLIFVQRRDCVFALTEVLKHHPRTKDAFRVGSLVGASDSVYRRGLDITRGFQHRSERDTLDQFRIGDLDLLVATAVAEEGIDVQACRSVIRWDAPPTMVSYIQSRGRARRQGSFFTLLIEEGPVDTKDLALWQEKEKEMIELYRQAREEPRRPILDDEDDLDQNAPNRVELRSPVTGALLSLASAASHLNHFCDVIPGASHYTSYKPIYEFDPPDLPEGWHALENREDPPPPQGPFGCTVTLPRLLPPHLRVFTTPTAHRSKASAYRHVAFMAYKALYEEGLLNEHFLPLTSVLEPELEEEIQDMLKDVESRAGTSNVQVQMDPWIPLPEDEDFWWHSIIEINGLPPIQLLTKVRPEPWVEDDGPVIYRPGSPSAAMTLTVKSCVSSGDDLTRKLIAQATLYTRKLFFSLFGSRMDWSLLDFCYLLVPSGREDMETDWIKELEDTLPEDASGEEACSVPLRGEDSGFDFSKFKDIALVKKHEKNHRFGEWIWEVSPEEREELQEREHLSGQEIELPVLRATPLPPRRYFTMPLVEVDPKANPTTRLLARNWTRVVLLSKGEAEGGILLPTILRCIAISNTVKAFKETVLAGSGLETIPSTLLTTSLLAPAAGERENYQRLETLGDTVLKFLVAIQLLGQYPLWHEGYLTRKKDHAVNNSRLAKEAIRLELYKFIIRDRFIAKKWKPTYFSSSPPSTVTSQPIDDEDTNKPGRKGKKKTEQLSVKLLADVVESLIGAAYLHGSFELAFRSAKLFDIGLHWEPLSDRLDSILARVEAQEFRLSATFMPPQIGYVEKMIGYKFRLPELLLEALTHASHCPVEELHGISYERMEFLGDAVLDMVVTDFLYHAPGLPPGKGHPSGKRYTPGHIHLRKSAMVNIHFLGYICLKQFCEVETRTPTAIDDTLRDPEIVIATETQRVWLYQCLLHSSSIILEEQRDAFARYNRGEEDLDKALHPSHFGSEDDEGEPSIFPWGELTRLQAPKFLSDMIESILGAVYLDSQGDMNIVKGVLRQLGWWDILERMVQFHMDVLHPVSRVALWAASNRKKEDGKSHHKPEYKISERGGNVVCTLTIGDEKIAEVSERNQGKSSKEQVRFLAAEQAMRKLRIKGVKTR